MNIRTRLGAAAGVREEVFLQAMLLMQLLFYTILHLRVQAGFFE